MFKSDYLFSHRWQNINNGFYLQIVEGDALKYEYFLFQSIFLQYPKRKLEMYRENQKPKAVYHYLIH